jgi:HAD superfamily, subfamily IIIB (Acid phosphatase)
MSIGSFSRKRLYALAGVIAAVLTTAGLLGSGVASAHGQPAAPRSASDIPNLGRVELRIEAYYGDPDGTGVASPTSNYARQTDGIAARTQHYLQARLSHPRSGKPALVLDIDDTSLLTYGYEVSESFGYTPASNLAYLQTHTLPAVFGMTTLADWAASHGITVFWITGRPESQRTLTQNNLAAVGYTSPADQAHVFLKPASPPAYLTCGTSCTTIQYKSLTRKHIEAQGYDILADMGDQFSDLKGGFADRTVKLPNPMYYIP